MCTEKTVVIGIAGKPMEGFRTVIAFIVSLPTCLSTGGSKPAATFRGRCQPCMTQTAPPHRMVSIRRHCLGAPANALFISRVFAQRNRLYVD